jgi:predicted nucleic acid-binding protein
MSASRKTLAPDEDAAVIWLRLDEVRKALPLVIPPPETLERARELHVNQHIHFWDAMVYAACIEAGVTRIYSEDLPGSVVAGLEVVNPFS